MPTIRNARGSDLIVTDANETVFFGVQSKALGKRSAVVVGNVARFIPASRLKPMLGWFILFMGCFIVIRELFFQ